MIDTLQAIGILLNSISIMMVLVLIRKRIDR